MAERIDKLRAIPDKWAHPPAEKLATLDRGRGVKLSYFGHADTTLALIDVDPEFTYDYRRTPDGRADIYESGKNLVLEGTLTVLAVTRPCIGTCQNNKGEPEKELIGDLLRNGALRFGIATGLWSKVDDATDDNHVEDAAPHPLSDRVGIVVAEMRGLTDTNKDALKSWADGRSLSGASLLADERWLTYVEDWLAQCDPAVTELTGDTDV